jgi:hypothetical protein
MLFPNPLVRRVVLEHREVDAVDDVVVYYQSPGVNDRGSKVAVDFHQLKYHVAHIGAVDHEKVIDPDWTGTRYSLLQRLAQAWTEIRSNEPQARLSLVTNWAWDPASPIAPLLRDGGRLSDELFSKGGRSTVGKIRKRWQDATGLSEAEFKVFASVLRFSTSAVSSDDAESWLNDRCQLAGLVPLDAGADHSPYDDLGARFIETGRTEHTPESLRSVVVEQGLVAKKEPPYRSTYAVRSFSRFAHVPQTDGACVVDLTDLFRGRQALSPESWITEIPRRLEASLAQVESLEAPVHVALDAHLSVAWFAGTLLDAKVGKQLILRQRVKGKGIELWDVSTPQVADGSERWKLSLSTAAQAGAELALAISVTHSALADAARFVTASLPGVARILHAELPHLGPRALKDGPHARLLADELVRALTATVAELRPKRLHVFPACPASLMFLLGQEARVLGPTTVYEFAFGAADRQYTAGVST